MSFDPSSLTVKKAIAKLDGLTDEELNAVYDAELEGKGRKSLLDAVTSARDDIRENSAEEEVVVEEPVVSAEPVEVEEINASQFLLLSQQERLNWKCLSAERFVKIG